VTSVVEVKLGLRHITLESLSAGRKEDLIVLTPHDEDLGLMLLQVSVVPIPLAYPVEASARPTMKAMEVDEKSFYSSTVHRACSFELKHPSP
jgi:hypothetical protein